MQVTTLLISHNGARWLPAVLDGVAEQTRAPDRCVAVDTGSDDESPGILRERAGWRTGSLGPGASFAEAVRVGLEDAPVPAGTDPSEEWVWILHDDSRPAPQALSRLLRAARQERGAQVFGPKLREWPSLRRLLETGVTISGTGRRETGLERGEYDQGQHDQRREVLAVNTAGMLVRRDVLERLGLDPDLPVYGNDLDFGWRAARAGHRTMIVPDAVVFHAEAAARGQRRSRATSAPHRQARAAALHTLLVNGPSRTLPLQAVRLLLGSLLRALGLLLARAPGLAAEEVAAVLSVLTRPGRIARGRRARRETATVPEADVRPLLAPWWLPYRHGADSVGDFLSALLSLGRDTAARGSVSALELLEDEDQPGRTPPGLLSLLARNPLVWLVVGTLGLAVATGWGQLTGGSFAGGALAPAPGSADHWWDQHAAAGHLLGSGSAAAAAPYVLPLAVAATLLLGSAQALTSLLVLFCVPIATLSALRFLRKVTTGRVAAMFGALAYGLLPVVSGALSHGRLGTVVGALLLPWVATAALYLLDPVADRRWRAGWRTGLGLALLTAFVPYAWALAVVAAVALLVGGLVLDRGTWAHRSRGGPLLAVVVSPVVLLLPWVADLRGIGPLLVEAGRADAPLGEVTVLGLLAGRAGDGGAPAWLGLLLAVAAVLALLRDDTRHRVRWAWAAALLAALFLVALTRLPVDLPGLAGVTRAYPGFAVLLLQAALLTAVVLGADGLWRRISSASFTWRQPVAALAAAAALVSLVGGAVWWVAGGLRPPVEREPTTVVPTYMTELAVASDTSAVLVLQGGPRSGVTYELLRRGTPVVGDDAITARTAPDPRLTSVVGDLVSGTTDDAAQRLAAYGVAYVVAPRPVSPTVQGALDATTSLSRASEGRRGDAAWRLQVPRSLSAVDRAEQPGRAVLLALQALAVVAVLVLAAPGRAREEGRS